MKTFAERRNRFLEAMPKASIAVFHSGQAKYRNQGTEYPFRADSNFYYLSNVMEPDSVLVLSKSKTGEKESIIFCLPRDPAIEVWTGPRLGLEGMLKEKGFDKAYAIEELNLKIPALLENKEILIHTLGRDLNWDQKLIQWLNTARNKVRFPNDAPKTWMDGDSLLAEYRLIKSPMEIDLMRQAAKLSVGAHQSLMKSCKPNKMEFELEAEFLQGVLSKGARALAYPSIVGGGENACILHYTQNDKPLKAGELVLVDAGAEYQYYASDITRTYPVSGKFSEEQKAIYNLVLKAQLATIEKVKPGTPWNALQETIVEVFTKGLSDLNIPGDLRSFYMHSSGHWLGLDVHDVGKYYVDGTWRPLMPGMVLTVEPGLYIPKGAAVDKRWWGIGVRIEDDILVTESGYDVLTQDLPKTVEAIEKLMHS